MNKKFLAATFTLSGAMIGAGILGLPYLFAKSGFLIGVFWLVVVAGIIMYVNLCLGETTLRMKKRHQLSGMAKKYLGTKGQIAMFIAVSFGVYSALTAYLIGEGQSLSQILPGNLHPVLLGTVFWLVMTLTLREGLKGLKKVETYGVIGVILLVIGICVYLFRDVSMSNLLAINPSDFFVPLGVTLFSMLGFTSIPEIREEIRGSEKYYKKAIIIGILIPLVLYTLFTAAFIGALGSSISEIATLSFGPLVTALGIFTMATSYLVLSFSMKDTYTFDFKLGKINVFILTSLVPLGLYYVTEFFSLGSFTQILGVAGVLSGGATGILILIIAKKSQENTKETPLFTMPINNPIIIIISILFIIATILQIGFG